MTNYTFVNYKNTKSDSEGRCGSRQNIFRKRSRSL